MTQLSASDISNIQQNITKHKPLKSRLEELYIVFGSIFNEDQFFQRFKTNIFHLNGLVKDKALPTFRTIRTLMEEFEIINKSQEKEMLITITTFYYFLYKNFISIYEENFSNNPQASYPHKPFNNCLLKNPLNKTPLNQPSYQVHPQSNFSSQNCQTFIPNFSKNLISQQTTNGSQKEEISSSQIEQKSFNISPIKKDEKMLGKKKVAPQQMTTELFDKEISEKIDLEQQKKEGRNKDNQLDVIMEICSNEKSAESPIVKARPSPKLPESSQLNLPVEEKFTLIDNKKDDFNEQVMKPFTETVALEDNDVSTPNHNEENSKKDKILMSFGAIPEKIHTPGDGRENDKRLSSNIPLTKPFNIADIELNGNKSLTPIEKDPSPVNENKHDIQELNHQIADKMQSESKTQIGSKLKDIFHDDLFEESSEEEGKLDKPSNYHIFNEQEEFDKAFEKITKEPEVVISSTTIQLSTADLAKKIPDLLELKEDKFRVFKSGDITSREEMETIRKLVNETFRSEYNKCFRHKRDKQKLYFFETKIKTSKGDYFIMKYDKEAFEYTVFEYVNK